MKRIIGVLALTVVMAAIVVLASVVPAFAAEPTTYDCYDSTGALIAAGFYKDQAKQVETNNPDPGAYCLQRIP